MSATRFEPPESMQDRQRRLIPRYGLIEGYVEERL